LFINISQSKRQIINSLGFAVLDWIKFGFQDIEEEEEPDKFPIHPLVVKR
jgi:hypothetical protein